jgi:hypothetical protein
MASSRPRVETTASASAMRLRQSPFQHAAENLQSVQFLGAHRQGSQFVHVDLQARHGGALETDISNGEKPDISTLRLHLHRL